MSTLDSIQTLVVKLMNLFNFDALMAIGILVMLLAIVRSGQATKRLKERNERQRRRLDVLYHDDRSDLAHH